MPTPIPFAGSSKLYIPDVTIEPLHAAFRVSQEAIDSFEIAVKNAINAIADNANETARQILTEQQGYVESVLEETKRAAETATGIAEDAIQGHLAWVITIADELGVTPAPMVAAARGQSVSVQTPLQQMVPNQITAQTVA